MALPEVVITGVGVLSPIGIGRQAMWESLLAGRSGVRPIRSFDTSSLPVRIGAAIDDFDPSRFVAKRKSLKLMNRDAQFGVAAAALACQDANIGQGAVDPSRFGVVLGADRSCVELEECLPTYQCCVVEKKFDFDRWGSEGMFRSFPLLFLKVLPNMIASHIAIAQDARGPNNTIHQAELSSLLAISEATRTIQRGAADVMIAGGASSQMNPVDWIRHCVMDILSHRQSDPAKASRPFDTDRDGQVWGEGAGTLILESRRHAEARGARILARVLGCASTGQPNDGNGAGGLALVRAMRLALERAGLEPRQLGHVNAHGLSAVREDRIEAQALRQTLGDVPVFAPKSYFGNLGAAGGVVEIAASILAIGEGVVPPTLNYESPDPQCPIPVVHGQPLSGASPTVMAVNWTEIGQAAAVVLDAVG